MATQILSGAADTLYYVFPFLSKHSASKNDRFGVDLVRSPPFYLTIARYGNNFMTRLQIIKHENFLRNGKK
jgi:hypothetical protein